MNRSIYRLSLSSALLLTACDLVGADRTDENWDLSEDQVNQCLSGADGSTILEGNIPLQDPTRDEKLSGSSEDIEGRAITHIIAGDYSCGFYEGYGTTNEDGEPKMPYVEHAAPEWDWYWNLPEYKNLMQEGLLGGIQDGDPMYSLLFGVGVYLVGDDDSGIRIQKSTSKDDIATIATTTDSSQILKRLTGEPLGGTLNSRSFWGVKSPIWDTYEECQNSNLPDVLKAARKIFETTDSRDGVLWTITDNIIEDTPGQCWDKNGDGKCHKKPGDEANEDSNGDGTCSIDDCDGSKNREFYETLRDDPRWQVVYAYPMHKAPKGAKNWLGDSTLMVYGMYYSSREQIDETNYYALARGDDSRLSSKSTRDEFERYGGGSDLAGKPFKLKPNDLDVVQVQFSEEVVCPAVEKGDAFECESEIEIKNLLEHRSIDGAEFHFTFGQLDPWGTQEDGAPLERVYTALPIDAGEVTLLDPPEDEDRYELSTSKEGSYIKLLSSIPPEVTAKIKLKFEVPAITTEESTLKDHHHNMQFKHFVMVGDIKVGIKELKTSMKIAEKDLGTVYGVDSLPSLFKNPNTDNLRTSICIDTEVENPDHFLSLLALGGFFLLILGGVGIAFLLKPTYRNLSIDGSPIDRIRLSRIGSTPIEHGNHIIAKAKLGMNGQPMVHAVKPFRCMKKGSHWELKTEGDTGQTYKVELTVREVRRASRGSGSF